MVGMTDNPMSDLLRQLDEMTQEITTLIDRLESRRAERDEIIRVLRGMDVSLSNLSKLTGMSPARISQIASLPKGTQ